MSKTHDLTEFLPQKETIKNWIDTLNSIGSSYGYDATLVMVPYHQDNPRVSSHLVRKMVSNAETRMILQMAPKPDSVIRVHIPALEADKSKDQFLQRAVLQESGFVVSTTPRADQAMLFLPETAKHTAKVLKSSNPGVTYRVEKKPKDEADD